MSSEFVRIPIPLSPYTLDLFSKVDPLFWATSRALSSHRGDLPWISSRTAPTKSKQDRRRGTIDSGRSVFMALWREVLRVVNEIGWVSRGGQDPVGVRGER